jgi:hypothetical protein
MLGMLYILTHFSDHYNFVNFVPIQLRIDLMDSRDSPLQLEYPSVQGGDVGR